MEARGNQNLATECMGAAQKGAGMMIINASKFQMTDLVIMGIVLIGVIGYAIDILMRIAENYLVPWKGK